MSTPTTSKELVECITKSGLVDVQRLEAHLKALESGGTFPEVPRALAEKLVRDGLLTDFQAEQFLQGKWRSFTIGKYKVLERLGAGGMGSVFLCEHKLMRRRVAVKVLPTAKADDPASLERFYREARAVAAARPPQHRPRLRHRPGRQAALPRHGVRGRRQPAGDRQGNGPAGRAAGRPLHPPGGRWACSTPTSAGWSTATSSRATSSSTAAASSRSSTWAWPASSTTSDDNLTKQYDEHVLGTADYLAPEQAIDSHAVDIRGRHLQPGRHLLLPAGRHSRRSTKARWPRS